jgi:hypothetical protein
MAEKQSRAYQGIQDFVLNIKEGSNRPHRLHFQGSNVYTLLALKIQIWIGSWCYLPFFLFPDLPSPELNLQKLSG